MHFSFHVSLEPRTQTAHKITVVLYYSIIVVQTLADLYYILIFFNKVASIQSFSSEVVPRHQLQSLPAHGNKLR